MVSRCLHLIFAPLEFSPHVDPQGLFPYLLLGISQISHVNEVFLGSFQSWTLPSWPMPIPFPWLLFHCLYRHVTILYNLYFLSALILYYVNLPSPKNKLHEGRDLEETDSEADSMSECKDGIWKQLTWPKELWETQKQPEPKYWRMNFGASVQRTECNSSSGLSPERSFYHAFQQQAFSLVSFSQIYSVEKQKLTSFIFS